VSFHTFSLSEDRCVSLLIKSLFARMPEAQIREELAAMHIDVQGVMQLRSRRRDMEKDRDRPLTPNFIVSVAQGRDVAKVRALTDICGLRVKVETYVAPKWPMQFKRCKRVGLTQRNCGHAPRCLASWDAPKAGSCATSKEHLKCCSCGGNHTANYRGCKWKEAKAAAAKRVKGERGRKDGVSTRLPAPSSALAKSFPEQENLGPACNHVVRGCRVIKAKAAENPAPTPPGAVERTERRAVTKDGNAKPARPLVKVAKPTPPAPKRIAPAPKKTTPSAKKTAPAPKKIDPTQGSVTGPGHHRSPGEPPDPGLRRVDMPSSRRGPFPSIRGARSRAVLKNVILFIAEYDCAA
jgi:hypothetical protein